MNAILVGVSTSNDQYDIEYSLNELKALAETLDYKVVFKLSQSLNSPNSKTYIGQGKLEELIIAIKAYDADIIIFNDELTPSQLRNNQDILKVDVIDRSFLILKIFEMRANTKEAKLEIKLAKNQYLLPRLSYLREKESRSGGATGSLSSKGAGETQLELDRRHLMTEINHLRSELNKISEMKKMQIQKRKSNDIPLVALVGYTNAGKSSTMNTLLNYCNETNKNVYVKDQLFATLQTYNKRLTYKKHEFILIDTIGFVSKLPHNLIHSFYQTLQEIKNADLIIHVLDSSSIYVSSQLEVVNNVLKMLGVYDIPTIYLLNKWDKTISQHMVIHGAKSIQFSNKTRQNIEPLMQAIYEEIGPSTIHVKLLIPYKDGNICNLVEEKANIYKKEYQEYGIYYDIELPIKLYSKVKEFDLDTLVS